MLVAVTAGTSAQARIFVCGFAQTAAAWAQALASVVPPHCDDSLLVADAAALDLSSDELVAQLAPYERIEIVAHSFGVRRAAYLLNLLPEEWFNSKRIACSALAGTVSAVGDGVGVPSAAWARTLEGMSVATMEQFYLNLFNTAARYFNLRGAPGTVRRARPHQQPLTADEFLARLHECTAELSYGSLACAVCYRSALSYLFSGDLTRLRGELAAAQLPLGSLGRTRFDRCLARAYGFRSDLICPATALKRDLGAAQVVAGPHLELTQLVSLLVED